MCLLFSACQSDIKQPLSIVGMTYHEARPIIIDKGWQSFYALQEDDVDSGGSQYFHGIGYYEVRNCTGIGELYCDFYFRNNQGTYLRIVTKGQDDGPNSSMQSRVISYEFLDKMLK